MAVPLGTISLHLEQGWFDQDDMDTLGLKGNVSVASMRAELATLLKPEPPPSEVDARAEADAKRAAESQAAAQAEAQTAADRAALIASIQSGEAAKQNAIRAQNEADQIVERFKEALKADPNATLT